MLGETLKKTGLPDDGQSTFESSKVDVRPTVAARSSSSSAQQRHDDTTGHHLTHATRHQAAQTTQPHSVSTTNNIPLSY